MEGNAVEDDENNEEEEAPGSEGKVLTKNKYLKNQFDLFFLKLISQIIICSSKKEEKEEKEKEIWSRKQ